MLNWPGGSGFEVTPGSVAISLAHFEKSMPLAGIQSFTAARGGLARALTLAGIDTHAFAAVGAGVDSYRRDRKQCSRCHSKGDARCSL